MTLGLILNTRATFYQERFHLVFGYLPWAIFDCPVTLPEPMAMHIPPSSRFDALIFTSQVAVYTFAPPPDWLSKNSDGSTRVIPLPQTLSMALNPAKYARKVPDLTGLTAEQVTGALAALDLTAQIIDLSPNAGKSQRIVKDLLPKPGTNLPAGATVKVNVIVPDA